MRVILCFKRFKLEDAIIISGEPRSGTTWLLNLLVNIPNTFTQWEPLHQTHGVVPKVWKWGDRIYIPKADNTERYRKLLKDILTLNVHTKQSIWHWQQSIRSLLFSKIVITKFVRANLLLSYITTNFELNNKPILIIRHPIDTCLSQMNAFDYNLLFPREIPDWMNNERYLEEADYLKSLSTVLEYNVALWCINNCSLLEDESTLSKLNIVFYSDLVMNPEKEVRILLNSLSNVKQTDLDNIIKGMNFRKASNTDFKQNYIPNPEDQLNKNIARLTAKEKDEIQRVFDYFDFKLYDAYTVFPKKEMLVLNI